MKKNELQETRNENMTLATGDYVKFEVRKASIIPENAQ
jgi:hypothetical protein